MTQNLSHPNRLPLLAILLMATGSLPTQSSLLAAACPLVEPHFFIQMLQEIEVLSQSLQLALQLHLAQENPIHILETRGERTCNPLFPFGGPTLAQEFCSCTAQHPSTTPPKTPSFLLQPHSVIRMTTCTFHSPRPQSHPPGRCDPARLLSLCPGTVTHLQASL